MEKLGREKLFVPFVRFNYVVTLCLAIINGTRMLLNVTENNRIHSIELKLRELPFI